MVNSLDETDWCRILSKLRETEPKAENYFMEKLDHILSLGYKPKKIIVLPTTILNELSSICGIQIEQRILRDKTGNIIEMAFEE